MFQRSKWLIREAKLRLNYMTTDDCIFCKIVKEEKKTEKIMETKTVLAFADANPVARVHILIVPKRHIEGVMSLVREDGLEVIEMFEVAKKIARNKKLDAYRLTFNAGRFQHVPHLHMHLLAGGPVDWTRL